MFCGDAAAAVRAVGEQRAAYAVLPAENSVSGPFVDLAEAFFEGRVRIVGETMLMIRHCLLASPGAQLEDLAVVAAHPTTLAQCRDWLTRWGWAARPCSDVTDAARTLAHSDEQALAVLGSWELGATHGLDVLAEGIADQPDNRTRFLVLGPPDHPSEAGQRHAIQVGPLPGPRKRKNLRIQLESLGASRVRVPFLGAADGRRFVVEFDHAESGAEIVREACNGVPHEFLGTWDPGRAFARSA